MRRVIITPFVQLAFRSTKPTITANKLRYFIGAQYCTMQKDLKVLCAFDKFKDSATARDIGDTVISALKQKYPQKNIKGVNIPLSDGGEGFLKVLSDVLKLQHKKINVTGPLGNKITVEYGLSTDEENKFAVIEMATTSGLELVPLQQRNPYKTTTKGLGEAIMDAYNSGCTRVLMGIGGSATVDAGLGALQVMGLKIKCKKGNQVYEPTTFCGEDLVNIMDIDLEGNVLLPKLSIDVACDVQNPLIGPLGAVNVFGKQKGANEEQRKALEEGMCRFAELVKKRVGIDISNLPGAGAAGGVGGSFRALTNAKLQKGITLIADYVGLENAIKNSNLVFTGEGCYDAQTEQGKVISLVESLCKKYNVPRVIICGKNTSGKTDQVYELLSMFTFEESMKKTKQCLAKIVDANADKFPVFKD